MQLFKNIDNFTKFQLDLDNAISTYIQQLFLEEFRSCVNADIIPFKRIPTIQAGTILLHWIVLHKTGEAFDNEYNFPQSTYSDIIRTSLHYLHKFAEKLDNHPLQLSAELISTYHELPDVSWPQWSHNIQYWLDGTHVRWVLRRNQSIDKTRYSSFKLNGKSALSTQVLWNGNGEAVWTSNSYPASRHDHTIMNT